MHIRPMTLGDLERLIDIDGTVESSQYLRLERAGEGLAMAWRLEQRPLRTKLVEPNRINEDASFLLRQIITGADEGLAFVAEHEETIVASVLAQLQPADNTILVLDLRVDFDSRRQGVGLALLYQIIHEARQQNLRAVMAKSLTNNLPAGQFLLKAGFDLAGLDTHRCSNHDLVKETVTLLWCAALD